jgi:predicted Zn-dependent protease
VQSKLGPLHTQAVKDPSVTDDGFNTIAFYPLPSGVTGSTTQTHQLISGTWYWKEFDSKINESDPDISWVDDPSNADVMAPYHYDYLAGTVRHECGHGVGLTGGYNLDPLAH